MGTSCAEGEVLSVGGVRWSLWILRHFRCARCAWLCSCCYRYLALNSGTYIAIRLAPRRRVREYVRLERRIRTVTYEGKGRAEEGSLAMLLLASFASPRVLAGHSSCMYLNVLTVRYSVASHDPGCFAYDSHLRQPTRLMPHWQ